MEDKYALIIKISVIVLGVAFLIFLLKNIIPIIFAIAAGLLLSKLISKLVNEANNKGE